ncbi:MAG: hypothetical protein HUK15_09445 [Bacteroidales bacterium]|nr:hypothetical protein [Bacteroidales bacterium]
MKTNKLLLLTVLMTLASISFAQRADVTEINGTFGKEAHPALATKVMFSDAKTVTKEFLNLLKTYNPLSITNKKGLIFADDARIPALSDNPVDVYATINQPKGIEDVEVVVSFYLGGNVYISSSVAPTQYQTAYGMIKTFANNLTEANHNSLLQAAGKALDKEEKKLASLEKKNASYQKTIDSCNESIKKIEQKRDKAHDKQKDMKEDLEKQRAEVYKKRDAYKKIEKL